MSAFPVTATDTGTTFSEALVTARAHVLSTTGTTISDQFIKRTFRSLSTTGTTITESNFRTVVPAAWNQPVITSSRNWGYTIDTNKWTIRAHENYSYSTLGD